MLSRRSLPATARLMPVATIAFLAILAHLILLLPLSVSLRGSAVLLLLGLPGMLAARLLLPFEEDRLDGWFLGLCGAFVLPVLLLFALHTVPGPLSSRFVLGASDVLLLFLGALALRGAGSRAVVSTSTPPIVYALLGIVVLIGTALRLMNLGSAEFQGDEARAMLFAREILRGRDDILLYHRKGPVEVLLVVGPLAVLRQTNEWVARLPFAVAGIGVLLGVFVIARRLFRHAGQWAAWAGMIAAAILAVDGFLVAFSRVVQYQSVLVLMLLGGLWCCWRFYEGGSHARRYLFGAALCVTVALLSHYDGIFFLPVALLLVFAGVRRRGWGIGRALRELSLPCLVSLGLLASFYVPFVLNEHFASTLRYLTRRVNRSSDPAKLFNNLVEYYRRATFYNTRFQIDLLAAVLLASLSVLLWRLARPRWAGRLLAVVLVGGAVVLVRDPQLFQRFGSQNLAILALGVPILGLALAPGVPLSLRALIWWFGAPFIAEAFLIRQPMTHFYTIDAPAALLIATGAMRLVEPLPRRHAGWLRAPIALAGCGVFALAVPYMYLVFVRQEPEYRHSFPIGRPVIYRAVYGDKLPAGSGFFGFPHRSGWKLIGTLYDQGVLQGSYSSNEDYYMTQWYTRDATRCDADPDYYFVVPAPEDKQEIPEAQIRVQYHIWGSVTVDGVKKMDIYSRGAAADAPQTFALDGAISAFDQHRLPNYGSDPVLYALAAEQRKGTAWQAGLELVDHGLDNTQLPEKETSTLWFRWHMTEKIDQQLLPFLDIVDASGTVVGAVQPQCRLTPLSAKTSDGYYTAAFSLRAGRDLPTGVYTLRLGLRDMARSQPLALADGTSTLPVAALAVNRPQALGAGVPARVSR